MSGASKAEQGCYEYSVGLGLLRFVIQESSIVFYSGLRFASHYIALVEIRGLEFESDARAFQVFG